MKIIITLTICLLLAATSFAAGNVKLYTDLEFSNNSVQQKAYVLPICFPGEVLVNSSGAILCGKIKMVPNGIAACVSGVCAVSTCSDDTHADCDGNGLNGCEADLTTIQSCGACGNVCGEFGSCTAGKCTYPLVIVSMTPSSNNIMEGTAFTVTVTIAAPATNGAMVKLSYTNPNIIMVTGGNPIISAGQTQTTFNVIALSAGTATITGTLANIPYQLMINVNPAICGDGIVAGTEQCDDGNTANGDGCSSMCTIEGGYVLIDGFLMHVCTANNPCLSAPANLCSDSTTANVFFPIGQCSPFASAPYYSCSYLPQVINCAASGLSCISGSCQ